MACISPILVRGLKDRDFVPCGKCNECLKLKRDDWSFRLKQELKVAVSAKFLTLTYSDDHVRRNPESGLPELCKRDVQLFMKRLRKESARCSDIGLRYYTVGEYGTNTLRPHYHSIMFNIHPDITSRVDRIWGLGHVDVGEVTPASIHYTTKYVINRHMDFSGREPPFSVMSKRPGIGANYVDTHKQWHRDDMRSHVQVGGVIARLPRYYREKFFSQSERQRMAREAISEADDKYWEEFVRLGVFQEDPAQYMDEVQRDKHDKVKSKLNDFNTF